MTLATFLDDLADYLEAGGITGISISGNFEQFAEGVYLYPYGGLYPQASAVISDDANPHGLDLQILVSKLSNREALQTIAEISLLLKDKANIIMGDTKFLLIEQKYGPFFIGKNHAGYFNYTLSYGLLLQ